jgi:hypothetical protein
MTIKQHAQLGCVADVDLGESITRVPRCLRDGGEVRRVGKFVDIDDRCAGLIEQVPDHGRPDEAGAAGDEYRRSLDAHVDLPGIG